MGGRCWGWVCEEDESGCKRYIASSVFQTSKSGELEMTDESSPLIGTTFTLSSLIPRHKTTTFFNPSSNFIKSGSQPIDQFLLSGDVNDGNVVNDDCVIESSGRIESVPE